MRAGRIIAKLMMFGAPDTVPHNSARIPSIVILGADALLAALPATPIQLAHACMRIGYHHVVPASWGDELIALATLRELRNHSQAPAIQCSCPFVANRLLAVGTDLRPFLISLVSPPVVLGRYLRNAASDRKLRLTYVGRCPGAADESIDARLTPEELLATFADHRIDVAAQPEVFDSVIPPDRRRHRSQPGGLPTPEMLWLADANSGGARTLTELHGDELPVELAQHLLAGKPTLIDVAPRLGCVCSGVTAGADPNQARARVTSLEPPRASSPVIDESLVTDAGLPLPASPRNAIDVVAPPAAGASTPVVEALLPNESSSVGSPREEPMARAPRPDPAAGGQSPSPAMSRRHTPTHGVARLMSSGLPIARDADGRQLPRTYVARRRSPARPSARQALEVETPIPTSRESAIAAPRDENGARSTLAAPAMSEPASTRLSVATSAASTPSPASTERNVENGLRHEERPATPPVTSRFEAARRDARSDQNVGERPVMQLLTLGLLIAMIVLISAAIGLVVGRWMTQR